MYNPEENHPCDALQHANHPRVLHRIAANTVRALSCISFMISMFSQDDRLVQDTAKYCLFLILWYTVTIVTRISSYVKASVRESILSRKIANDVPGGTHTGRTINVARKV